MAARDCPGSKLKFDEDHQLLREVVYAGLKDLNTGFDCPLIGHFSPADFLVVLDRCERLRVRAIGTIGLVDLSRGIWDGLTSPSERPSVSRRQKPKPR
jgi:hypothetical protein